MTFPIELLIEILTFGVVVVGALAASRSLETMWGVRRRLGVDKPQAMAARPIVQASGVSSPFLRWVQASTSLNDEKDRKKLSRDLAAAGFRNLTAPVWFVIARFSAAIGLPFLFLFAQRFSPNPMTGMPLILFALVLCGLGLLGPTYYVRGKGNQRRAQLEQEFPDALDLLVVCVEAGLGLEAAFIRVASEVKESHPRIAEEFNNVSDHLRAGSSRVDALRALADRAGVEAVSSFVALLIQTDTLGTSVGQTLRVYAAEMREHRFLRAEEKAMRVPVLMTIPLVACILPVIVTALLLPPIIDVMRTLIPALSGRR